MMTLSGRQIIDHQSIIWYFDCDEDDGWRFEDLGITVVDWSRWITHDESDLNG